MRTAPKQAQYSTPEEAFAARTEWRGKCLVWTGGMSNGYGSITVNGRHAQTHRYSYEMVNGPIPEGLQIDHMCHNKACCNVEHLRLTTPKQNVEHRSGPQVNNTSGYLGVIWNKKDRRWRTAVQHGGKVYSAGQFHLHELHVAAHRVKQLRNQLFTHNDVDRINQ